MTLGIKLNLIIKKIILIKKNILAFIGDISDVAVISVGGVGHLLDSAIGQSDSV